MNISKACKGYTLIELLVVIAIIGILSAIGFNNFQDYTRQQQLLAAVRSTRTAILSARESAVAGTKPSTCMATDPIDTTKVIDHLTAYLFRVILPNKYRTDLSCTVTGNIAGTPVTLPAGITISAPVPNPIRFKALGQGTNIPSGGSATITITQTATGNIRTITIGENGDIQ